MIRSDEDLGGSFEFNHERIEKNMKLGYLDTLKAFNSVQGHIYYFKSSEFNIFLENFNLKTIYGLENAAKIYGVDKYKVYTYEEFIKTLLKRHNEAEQRYNKIKEKIETKKIMKYYKEITEMIDKGLGICLLMSLILEQPSIRNSKMINKSFSKYLEAAEAMIELTNYFET